MLVCSNTSPLSNLAIVGHLSLLWLYYGSLTIPEAVWAELSELEPGRGLDALEDARSRGLIRVLPVANRALVAALSDELHPGESEAIALALEAQADLLLMDEREGRAAAEHLGIKITGVLGVLRRARLEGRLASLRSEMLRLRQQAHFFISPSLEEALLLSVGEVP